jgi:hypothetical protein
MIPDPLLVLTDPESLKVMDPRDPVRRRLDTGWQTYRAIKVKLMLLLTNDQKTKNETKYNEDFLFRHILIYIILYWGKGDFLKKANFAPKWPFYLK